MATESGAEVDLQVDDIHYHNYGGSGLGGDSDDGDSGSAEGSQSEYEGSISEYSESEQPDRYFDPMPEHLVLPLELQSRILSLESSQFQLLWGTYRFVCKAWKEYIEHLAKTRWVRTGAFLYAGYMTRDAEENKVFLSGSFTFNRMEDDTVFFTDKCADKYRTAFIKACKATSPPDVELCGFVHDVEIPGMSVDWTTLTITCHWRSLVGRLFAEELRVEAHRHRTNKEMMTKVKRMPGDGMSKIEAAVRLFGKHVHGAYESVRRKRLGYTDKRGDERLKQARVAASWRLLEEEEDEDVEEEEDEDLEENLEASDIET
ncbi:hypothetical protein B0H16DRAFT_956009 [Mycena metata]|uniref:Uncharacterized protein n=1 Tax=Mycena metata TaxID=1033252 RepID=A0AAD7K3C8_9AGAR|nr:hypothetical protein B0H16DRAFT_956009 [Mycena metata]